METTEVRLQLHPPKPFADAMAFGNFGPYESLSGTVAFAVDPDAPAYRSVVDLAHASRNPSGQVEFSTDLFILRPVELERGNGRVIYDVNNRGNKRILQFFNDAVHSNEPSGPEHAGNGFLMRRGYSLVWSGWQGDISTGDGRLTVRLPVATDEGREITGLVRTEFLAEESGIVSYPLSGNDYTSSYEAVSLDTDSAIFTRREYEGDPRVPVPSDQWQFAALDKEGSPVPSASNCYLRGGFKPGWIYELVYTAINPLVMGLGFTGLRDLVSFLLRSEVDAEGTANPLRQNGAAMEKAYAWGRSQSGRFQREFVYRGFNVDAQGHRVFDAIWPHVSGAGRVTLNYRFAQPGRYPRQHSDHLYPSDQFPFAYDSSTDPLTGQTDGILKRPDTDPLVVHTQTSSEYWERRGSLVHTDSRGADLSDHQQSRVYLFPSTQHGADPLKGAQAGAHRHLSNPHNTTPLLRALLDALDAWATHGTPPPDSLVPSRASETGAPADVVKSGFPSIPDVSCPAEPNRLRVQDFGPDFESGIVSREPPEEDPAREYLILVPQVDADGNEVAGIPTPDLQVPLATYTGWNFRPRGFAEHATAGVTGSFLPLADTEKERRASGDSRLSIEERYASSDNYVDRVARSAQGLVESRLLLEEDAERYVDRARKQKIPPG